MMGFFLSFIVSLPVLAIPFVDNGNNTATLNKGTTKEKTYKFCPHCNNPLVGAEPVCKILGTWMVAGTGVTGFYNGQPCACSCSGVSSHLITLLEQISLILQQAKSSQSLTTILRKNINTLDLDTLKTMFTSMKLDLSEIQKVTSNQVSTEGWQEIYEYIDNIIKLNPSVDSKSNIHQQVETTLKLIESKSVSISKSLAQLEAEIYSKTLEKLNDASETAKKYFLPQLEAIHEANKELLKLN